ncbi:uncharacterized protein LOC114755871 [Neltuma alba]|uniref:uncharacterized protein LOC114755871 n=1 Tax=Neltuma alba TaxID=207710 RepID=UPI0010A40E9A|nr:uncharacterized protein LOC114755871 [Prosopis alba]
MVSEPADGRPSASPVNPSSSSSTSEDTPVGSSPRQRPTTMDPPGGSPAQVSSSINAPSASTINVDGSSIALVSEKLIGSNYREWAQAMRLAIGGRGKLGLITGESTTPSDLKSSEMQRWLTDNSLVCSWLINAMSPSLKRSFMYLPTAKDMWDAVRESYSDGEDLARLYDLKTRIWNIKQGTRTVTEYWLELIGLWQELDMITEEEWSSSTDAARHKNNVEKERVFQFLAGLNPEFDDIQSRILSR